VTIDGGASVKGDVISKSNIDIKNGSISSGKIESEGNVSLTWSANVKESDGIVASGNVTYPKYYSPDTPISTGVSDPFFPSSFPQFPSFPKLTETPTPLPPTGLKNKDNFELPTHNPYNKYGTISEDGSYSSIIIKGGSILTIDTHDSTLTLFVNDFEVTGGSEIHIEGNGTLKLFVNKFIMNGGTHITNGASNNILIYSNNSAGSIKIGGGADLQGNVYVYAPKSSFTLEGDTSIKGAVVAKSADLMGGVSLKPAFVPMNIGGNGSGGYKIGSWSY
jgi:cytoskeletal protein CcmA (bactofilin family)